MKITIVVLSLILLGGCEGEIDESDLIKGEEFCKDKIGVMKYRSNSLGDTSVYCKTSEYIYFPDYKLKGKK